MGDLLARFLERSGLEQGLEAASVISEWPTLVGPQIAAVTRPIRVSDDTLFVAVTTSAWMMELDLMKGTLMRYVNAGKRSGRIGRIVFLMAT